MRREPPGASGELERRHEPPLDPVAVVRPELLFGQHARHHHRLIQALPLDQALLDPVDLVAGDQLVVWSDGRATDELPDPAGFAGVEFVWRRPGPRPRFGHVEAPAFLPASGRLQIAVEVVDGDPAVGQLEVAAAAPAELLAMETRSAGAAGGVARIELDLAVAGELGGAAGLRS